MPRPESKNVKVLLTPSLLSGFVSIVIMLGLAVAVVLSVYFKGGLLHQSLQVASGTSTTTYQQLAGHFDRNKLLSNVPLLLFWACVGLITYLFANAIYRASRDVADLKAELRYVHVRRGRLREAFLHLAIRLAALIVWVFYVVLFFHVLLPLSLASIRDITVAVNGLPLRILHLIGGFLLGLLALHVHIIFVRLIMLRPRLWGVNYGD